MPVDRRDFDVDEVLKLPLMAHLSTISPDGPRDSPVWFQWEEGAAWLIGTAGDSFVRRLEADGRCALGVVDFDAGKGVLRHVGIRGTAAVGKMEHERLSRLLARYLGPNKRRWNQWFTANVVEPLDVMVKVTPQTIVAKDVSYFRTGPDLMHPGARGRALRR